MLIYCHIVSQKPFGYLTSSSQLLYCVPGNGGLASNYLLLLEKLLMVYFL